MRRPRMLLSGTVAVLCVVALLAADELRAKKPTTTITGVVKRAETYRGKTRSVYIEDRDAGDFLVVRGNELGKELLEQVGVTVTATGYVKEAARDLGFDRVIDILSYEIDKADEPAPERP